MESPILRKAFPALLISIVALFTSCGHGGGSSGSPGTLAVVVGAPIHDVVVQGGFNAYRAAVLPGALYKISLTAVTDDVDLIVYGQDSTFTNPLFCPVDNSSITGVSPEDCILPARGSTLFFGVDGLYISASASSYTITVELLSVTNLSLSTPLNAALSRTGAGVYAVSVDPGISYTVAIASLSDDADLHVFGNDDTLTTPAVCSIDNTLLIGAPPEDCTLASAGSTLYFVVDPVFSSAASMNHAALVAPAPSVQNPANEGTIATPVVIPENTVATGQVGYNGESFYTTTGLIPNARYTVSILGLTANASLSVYDNDSAFTNLASCLADNTLFTVTTPESCTFTASGSTLYSSVTSSTTSGGVAYLLLVTQGP